MPSPSTREAFADRSVDEGDLLPFDSADLGGCYAASIQGRVCFDRARGAFVQRVGRMQGAPFFEFSGEPCAEVEGFTLHANVCVHGRKRKRLERILR